MSFTLSNSEPIDPETKEARAWLATLQGNILKGHGREHAVYVFFALPEIEASAAAILQWVAKEFVTSALVQQQQTARYRRLGVSGGLFGNLFLSASGYRALGRDPQALFPERPQERDGQVASTFAGGMRATAQEDFADPPVTEWEPGYQARIDAMLLLADDDEAYLMRRAREVVEKFEDVRCTVPLVETGRALRDANGTGVEHFGFADGRSQPVYLREDFRINADNGRVMDGRGESLRQWDPFEPLERVLVADPGAVETPLCHGSFLVFRKLEQNVRAFHEQRRAIARLLGFGEGEEARAGALMVGRFEDGTPLTLQRGEGWHPAETNEFNFDSDVRGARCPLFSHIRKVNPRGHTKTDTSVAPGSRTGTARRAKPDDHERRRRITRRSITYDNRNRHPVPVEERDQPPAANVGVLFMCFQASIRKQFAFMQRHWCNNPDFPQGSTGADALVGQGPPRPLAWPTVYNDDGRRIAAPLEKMITMKGGEFFFAPSLPFFETLVRE